jgi:hypothetical protein
MAWRRPLGVRDLPGGTVFLEFGNYFVNLAKVDDINPTSEFPDTDVWDLYIEMDRPGSDPIPLRSGFKGVEHAKAFKRAVLRHACTTGLCTGEDMDQIFAATKPGPINN